MLPAHVDMSEISHSRSSAVNHFKATSKLTPKGIIGREQVCSKVAARKVVHESVICMSAFELSLPYVVMSVDEAWADNFVCTVDDYGLRGGNVCPNFCDLVVLD